jgi:hypothetical protein
LVCLGRKEPTLLPTLWGLLFRGSHGTLLSSPSRRPLVLGKKKKKKVQGPDNEAENLKDRRKPKLWRPKTGACGQGLWPGGREREGGRTKIYQTIVPLQNPGAEFRGQCNSMTAPLSRRGLGPHKRGLTRPQNLLVSYPYLQDVRNKFLCFTIYPVLGVLLQQC